MLKFKSYVILKLNIFTLIRIVKKFNLLLFKMLFLPGLASQGTKSQIANFIYIVCDLGSSLKIRPPETVENASPWSKTYQIHDYSIIWYFVISPVWCPFLKSKRIHVLVNVMHKMYWSMYCITCTDQCMALHVLVNVWHYMWTCSRERVVLFSLLPSFT